MQKKRIALVAPYGAEPRLDNYAEFILAQTLQERGWDVRLYTYAMTGIPGYGRDCVYKGVTVIRCRVRWGISPKLFFSTLAYRPRTVISFHPKSLLSFSAYWAARLTGARFIVSITGILHDRFVVDDVDNPHEHMKAAPVIITGVKAFLAQATSFPFGWLWENYILHMPTAKADTVVAINEDEKSHVKRIYGRTAEQIYYCTPRYSSSEEVSHVPHVPVKFLFFIGQIKRRKGWDTVIDALAALKKAGRVSHLVFVTPHTDTSEAVGYAKSLGVVEHITFLTSISNEERQWLYSHCEYVLVPSRYEGFGLPIFEAFLAHKPVCASDIPVFLEFLDDRKNAMLFRTGDGIALANAVLELDADPALRENLVREGVITAKLFSYPRMVAEYEKII